MVSHTGLRSGSQIVGYDEQRRNEKESRQGIAQRATGGVDGKLGDVIPSNPRLEKRQSVLF